MADVNKTIQISYEAKTQELEKALRRIPNITEEEVRKMSAEMSKQFKSTERAAERSSKKIGKSFKRAGKAVGAIAGAAALAGAGVIAFGQHLADLSNELVDASTKTGIAVDTLGGLRLAAEGAGVAFQGLEPGLIKLQGAIAKAAEGSGPAAKAFERLGIEARDAEGNLRGSDEVFTEITKSLSTLENQTEKNALAMDIFGMRAGPALLQSGALDNMEAFVNLSREFGVNMDQSSESAALFQRAMSELKLVFQGVGSDLLMAATNSKGLEDSIFSLSESVVFFGSITTDIVQSAVSSYEYITRVVEMRTTQISMFFQNMGHAINFEFDKINENTVRTFNELAQLETAAMTAEKGIVGISEAYENANSKVERLKTLREAALKAQEKENKVTKENLRLTEETATAAEQIKPAKKEDDGAQAQAAALKELLGIREDSVQAIMTEEELEQVQFENKLARIEELKKASGDMQAAEMAAVAVRDEFEQASHKRRLSEIQKQQEKELAFISTMSSSATATANAIESVLVDTGKITEEQTKKLHFMKQTAALSDIAVNTAVAITKALATLGPIGGPLAAAGITASGLAQSAAVIAQPVPTFDMGGMIGNMDRLRPGETFIRAQRGEAVLDEQTVNRLGGEQGVNALQRGGSPSSEVIVISPFKHLDRYNKSALRKNSVLTRRFNPIGSGAY
jgi:hypothetical protein